MARPMNTHRMISARPSRPRVQAPATRKQAEERCHHEVLLDACRQGEAAEAGHQAGLADWRTAIAERTSRMPVVWSPMPSMSGRTSNGKPLQTGVAATSKSGPPPGRAAYIAEACQAEGGNERHEKTDRGEQPSRGQGRRHGIAASAR